MRSSMQPFNLAEQKVRGVDLEMSYRTALSDLVSGVPGNLTLARDRHALHQELHRQHAARRRRIRRARTRAAVRRPGAGIRLLRTTVNPFSGTFSARGVSAGVVRQQPDRVYFGLSGLDDGLPDDQREPPRRRDLSSTRR